ncbi:MAG: hypothetical protein H7Z75_22515 [Ferruginibacter sp.]|nr:hypothetical protein [Cytophagales bacterium]
MKNSSNQTVNAKLAQILADADATIAEAEEYLSVKGVKYSLSEWVTLKEYTRRFGLESTNVVSNWIARGIVPPANVLIIEDLNNLKLVKAVPYKP